MPPNIIYEENQDCSGIDPTESAIHGRARFAYKFHLWHLEMAMFAFLTAYPFPAAAAPHCMTRILADVPAEEAPENVKSKSNGDFGPVTKMKVNRKTGKLLYCGENTYCYNSNAFEFTTPCRVKLDKEGEFGPYFVYFTR